MRYFVISLLALVGCVDDLPTCPGNDDLVCPRGTQCVLGTCVVEPAACDDFEDGRLCGDGAQICLAGACVVSTCGDGFTDPFRGESCDQGTANSDLEPDACRTSCVAAGCGDGVRDTGEDPYCLSIVDRVEAPGAQVRVVRADLEGDGHDDLLASFLDGELIGVASWRVEPATGRLGPMELIARFPDPFAKVAPHLFFADLDGDGQGEIGVVVSDAIGYGQVELLARRDGVWSVAGRLFAFGPEIVSLDTGDLNQVDPLDVLTVGREPAGFGGTIGICYGQNQPGLEVSCLGWTIDRPFQGSLAYMNDDDLVDLVLVTGDAEIETISVLEGSRMNGFGPAKWFPARATRILPVVDDVLGDPTPDIVLATDAEVQIVTATSSLAIPARMDALGVVNLDDDDQLDVVALDSAGLHLAHGDPLAFERVTLELAPQAVFSSPSAGSRLPGELVVVGELGGRKQIALLRAGDGVLGGARRLEFASVTRLVDVVTVDLDSTSFPDFLYLTDRESLVMTGDPALDPHNVGGIQGLPDGPLDELSVTAIARGDLDGDERDDLVVADSRGELAVFLFASGPMLASEPLRVPLALPATRLLLADADADGSVDVLAFDPASGQLAVLRNLDGNGRLSPAASASLPADVAKLVAVELDGQAGIDLVVLDGEGRLTVRTGVRATDGAPSWPAVTTEQPEVLVFAAADVVGDGRAELVIAGEDGRVNLASLEGVSLVGVPGLPEHTGGTVTDAGFMDVNDDQHVDLVILDDGLSVHLQTDTGRFTAAQRFPAEASLQGRLRSGDADGDGVTDVLLLDSGLDWRRGRAR